MQHIRERRAALGGSVPSRSTKSAPCRCLQPICGRLEKASGDRTIATTMAFVAVLRKLLQDKEIGKYIVPIIPDEARIRYGSLVPPVWYLFPSVGQLYEPV